MISEPHMILSGRCDVVLDKRQQSLERRKRKEANASQRWSSPRIDLSWFQGNLFKSREWASKRNKCKNSKNWHTHRLRMHMDNYVSTVARCLITHKLILRKFNPRNLCLRQPLMIQNKDLISLYRRVFPFWGQWDGSGVKAFTAKPDNLSSVP